MSIHHTSTRSILIGSLTLVFGSVAFAADSKSGLSDPANNLNVADRAGEETQSKILPRADGGFYVSWFDNTDGGYDVRLQRLDANGVEQWPHNGIVVADRNVDSTTDYGFAVDTAGNALLSFQCCTQDAADERIVAVKISPAGVPLWAPGGVAVSTPGEGELVSYIAATSDGNAVVAWTNDAAQGRAQKLDGNGTPMWGATGITLPGPPTGFKLVADIQPATGGDAIVAWSNQAGSTRLLRAQKLASANGAALWGTDGIRVSDAGGLSAGYFPKFLADGSGGAVFVYMDFVGLAASARVQHLDAAGTRTLGANGVLASTDTTRSHTVPSGSFDPVSGDIHLVWIDQQQIGGNSTNGLYAQRIDSAGTRLYGESGIELVPMTINTDGAQTLGQALALPAPGGFIATWVTDVVPSVHQSIKSVRLDAAGAAVWSAPVDLKLSPTRSSRVVGATSTLGFAAFSWSDGADPFAESNDIRAQQLPYSGVFGDAVFSDDFE
jgi:hypothetical protein